MAKIEISKEIKETLKELLSYNMEFEYTHYLECDKGERENHIYNKALILNDWFNKEFNKSKKSMAEENLSKIAKGELK